MQMTEEQKTIGRRNFLKAVAGVPGLAAFTYSFKKVEKKLNVGIIGAGNEGRVLLNNADPEFVTVSAVADINPINREIAKRLCTAKFGTDVTTHEDYKKLLEDPSIEAIITACPLHMHHPVTMDALNAGKHVLCEKLMAFSIEQCKEMINLAKAKGLILQIGHQRHYSAMYHQALEYVSGGGLGEVHHIRAFWHRNTKWTRPTPKSAKDVAAMFNGQRRRWIDEVTKDVVEEKVLKMGAADEVNNSKFTSFMLSPGDAKKVKNAITITDTDALRIFDEAEKTDFSKYGYENPYKLYNWRLYKKTSQGLMAELGSHQMDACSLLLGKVHPLAVVGSGHIVNKDDREVWDHVYVQYEFPKQVLVTYSSISSNKFENYGEVVYGTKGTMFIDSESETYLWPEGAGAPKSTEMAAAPAGAATVADTSASAPGGPSGGASSDGGFKSVSRGYMEEIRHFAVCCRTGETPRCDGVQAMVDAVIALKANEAIESGRRIQFDPNWFKA